MLVRVLAVGDVVGDAGIDMLSRHLRSLKGLKGVDFTVVNGENASGVGITPRQAERIFDSGADVITLGNHTWNRMEICDYLDDCEYILRPSNYAPQVPGRGWGVFECKGTNICVASLIGRCDMPFGAENPFFEADRLLAEAGCKLSIIDMHAEATSEKMAMGYYLDGRASAVFGTHTHVQTADCRVMPKGCGYISDVGMTGPVESVLGIVPEQSISRFLGNPPQRYTVAGGRCKLECAIFDIDGETGLCTDAESLKIMDTEGN